MAESKKQDENLLITDARLSYAYIYKPYEGDDGKKTYTSHLIIPENHPQMSAISATIRKVAALVFKDQADAVLAQLKAQDKLCIHRGDISKAGQDPYRGKLYISANNNVRPRILATVNGVNQEINEDHELAPYSGCYANVMIVIWAQNNKWGKRINAQLTGVQFLRHAERLGGGGKAASLDEFGTVEGSGADSDAPASGGGGLV